MTDVARIEIMEPGDTSRCVDLSLPATIGRQTDCSLQLSAAGVSRVHCRLWSRDHTLYLSDLDSQNGVYLFDRQREAPPVHNRGGTCEVAPYHELVIGKARIRAYILGTDFSQTASKSSFGTLLAPDMDQTLISTNVEPKGTDGPATEPGLVTVGAPDTLNDGMPKTLGKFRLERKVGQGGMGTVYLARHPRFKLEFAIKVLTVHGNKSDHQIQRILREMEISLKLRHPSIVRCFHCARSENFMYIVMPYYSGGSLAQLLERVGTLTVRRALRLADRVLAGVEYAHAQGIVHRDLKPQNILLHKSSKRTYVPLVSDFGLAKNYLTAGLSGITVTGTAGGSWGYMPREQLTDFCHVSPRGDVWSMGAILYQCLTNRLPRLSQPGENQIQTVLRSTIIPLGELRPELSPTLTDFTMSALAFEPTDRFADAGEMRIALRRVAAQCSVEL